MLVLIQVQLEIKLEKKSEATSADIKELSYLAVRQTVCSQTVWWAMQYLKRNSWSYVVLCL